MSYLSFCVWWFGTVCGGDVGICVWKYVRRSRIHFIRILLDKFRSNICTILQYCGSIQRAGGVHGSSRPLSCRYLIHSLKKLIKAWCIFTGLVTVGTIRTSLALFALFFVLTIALAILSAANYMGGDANLGKAGGYFGLMAALLAWYNAMAGLWNYQNSWITLPVGRFPWAEKPSH